MCAVQATISELSPKSRSLLADLGNRLVREKPLATAGGVILLVLILIAIFADAIAPYSATEFDLVDRLEGPSGQHLMGTDNLGRDVFSRIVYGARVSVTVGVVASLICMLVAGLVGLVTGYIGGKTDMVIQRFVDAWMCFPWLFLVLSIMALLGSGLVQVIGVLGVHRGIRNSRVVRSAVIGIKENVYMDAAVAVGSSRSRIMLRHIVPNIMAPLIVIFSISMGQMILAEATLSFLGYGVPPPLPTWGSMLSGDARAYMLRAPWLAIFPGLALALAVYGINMLGDGVRDILDPRLRGKLGRYGKKPATGLGK